MTLLTVLNALLAVLILCVAGDGVIAMNRATNHGVRLAYVCMVVGSAATLLRILLGDYRTPPAAEVWLNLGIAAFFLATRRKAPSHDRRQSGSPVRYPGFDRRAVG